MQRAVPSWSSRFAALNVAWLSQRGGRQPAPSIRCASADACSHGFVGRALFAMGTHASTVISLWTSLRDVRVLHWAMSPGLGRSMIWVWDALLHGDDIVPRWRSPSIPSGGKGDGGGAGPGRWVAGELQDCFAFHAEVWGTSSNCNLKIALSKQIISENGVCVQCLLCM